MSYAHLIQYERYQIQRWLAAGYSCREIGHRLGRSPSTVCRELQRNSKASGVYEAVSAHRRASRVARLGRQRPRISPELWACVEAYLRLDHSPEQVVAVLGRHGLSISHVRIYQHIAKDRRHGGTLWRHRRHRRRYRRHPMVSRRFTPGRRIRERPASVSQRRTVGHWELDTLRPGHGRAAVLCAVERKSRYVRLAWLKTGQARPLALALVERLRAIVSRVRSLTADRGSEFAWYWLIEDELQAPVYFCDPYCAWQRGTVENTNGLLRQYLPRCRDFSTITPQELQRIEDRINDRPRKVLGYRTPRQVFYASLKRCAS